MTFRELDPTSELPVPATPPGLVVASRDEILRHAPDTHLVLGDAGGVRATCSCWWNQVPLVGPHRVGVIGHYYAADSDAGVRLLQRACDRLTAEGCTLAVGPMDGNTWRRYRLVVERGTEPAFFLEPDNPEEWLAQFEAAGFERLASYRSALNRSLGEPDERLDALERRVAQRGVTIRAFDASEVARELRALYAVSIESFAGNFLYTPIGETEFLEQNQRLLPFIRPELVLMAEREGSLVGFIFAVPDILQAHRGQPIDTIILKTLAVVPDARRDGLGALLMGRVQLLAGALGYRRAIHALMHDENISRKMSERSAQTIRRYALFARSLGGGPPVALEVTR